MKNFTLWVGEKTNPIQSQTKPISHSRTDQKGWKKEKNHSVNLLMPDVEKNENIIFSSLRVDLLCYNTITLLL